MNVHKIYKPFFSCNLGCLWLSGSFFTTEADEALSTIEPAILKGLGLLGADLVRIFTAEILLEVALISDAPDMELWGLDGDLEVSLPRRI